MQAADSDPLLSTKLFIPPARPRRVPRGRLIDLLKEAARGPLTLVCAPAGYGKTTLLSEWIPQNEHCVTWVSLDKGDNDLMRFWRYFIAALQKLDPRICRNAQRMLESIQDVQIEAVLSLVVNELAGLGYRFSLVLDDYHLIENPLIDSSMLFLIEHLPPNVNLVVSSRSDPAFPLARWRARRQMAEIRSAVLRFTPEETADFFTQAMNLDLSESEIAALDVRTEGWIAGLQLAALSIRDIEDRGEFIAAFTGSHRFIIDYLVEEVLNQQTGGIREFLLTTSVLERLCAPLCNALTGQSDGQAILESLEQGNLFVVPLDEHRNWYRYHHLFAEVLQGRFWQEQPVSYMDMHRKASAWYELEGLIDSAVHHAIAASDFERAASLVERYSIRMLLRSEVLLIRSWLEKLPVEMVHNRPRLILIHGWMLVLTGHGQDLGQWLDAPRAAAVLAAPGVPPDILGELALLRATLARFQRNASLSLELAEQALGFLTGEDRGLQAGALYTIGVAHLQRGDVDAASRAFRETAVLGETNGGPYMAMLALQELSELQIKQGQLSQAFDTCQRAVSMARRWRWQAMPAAGMAQIYAGQVLYERNDLVGAMQSLDAGVDLLQGSIEQYVLAQGLVSMAQCLWAGGDREGAFAAIRRGEEWFTRMQVADTGAGTLLDMGKVRLWVALDNLEEADSWSRVCRWLPEDTDPGYFQAVTLVRLRLAQAQQLRQANLLPEGLEIIDRLLDAAEAKEWWGRAIELLILRARLCWAQSDAAGCLLSLERALALAGPEGYIRSFVDAGEQMRLMLLEYQGSLKNRIRDDSNPDSPPFLSYIERLLGAFADPAPAEDTRRASVYGPLSERELDVLHLIATGHTNQEIADLLFIVVSTVKSHINSLYGKLGANRRTQAIAIARSSGLLPE